jgi:hypothetical protein
VTLKVGTNTGCGSKDTRQGIDMGIIEVDLFSEDVDSLDHPEVVKFRGLLEEVADEYQCYLISFEIERGTVLFSFGSDALNAKIIRLLQTDST